MLKFDVVSFKENEDGSANIQVEMDDKTKSFLIQEGVLALIERGLMEHPLPEEAYDDTVN